MDYNKKIKEYIIINNIEAEHIELKSSCHTVEEAAQAVNASVNELVKNICMIDENGQLIVAIVHGKDRVSTTKVGKELKISRPRLAEEDEVLNLTGYPIGGLPSFGFNANFLIDKEVIDLDNVYTGGGSVNSLIKINVEEMKRANGGRVVKIKK